MSTINLQSCHTPVLYQEVLEALDIQTGDIVVDGTLGLGGHAAAMLEKTGPTGHLYGFDWDERNLKLATKNLEQYSNKTLIHSSFAHLQTELSKQGRGEVNAILLDLGLSSAHLQDPERGISFRNDGPLDMRMNTDLKRTAADIIATASSEELADIFYYFGELKSSRRLSEAIVNTRTTTPLTTTADLKAIVQKTFGEHTKTLPQVFQALRIAVNDELGAISAVLPQARDLLAPGGTLAVISFHSLEDRLVKNFIRETFQADRKAWTRTKKPIIPTPEEITANPPSRSAKLRVLQKAIA